jgi:nitrogenase molybdenum-iron protein NifN
VTPGTGPVSTTNACRMCMPLGACLAFAGIEGTVPILHGGQGCATYIRRYLISHFNEPFDVGSSSFDESATVFGGEESLAQGIRNVVSAYGPRVIGVATTCLAETIGEDVPRILASIRRDDAGLPPLVGVSTPSYAGTHAEGYQAAVAAVVGALAGAEPGDGVTLLPGIVSPADLRHLRELASAFGLPATLVPDISDSLDGPIAAEPPRLRPGGTPLGALARCGGGLAAVTLGGLVAPGVPSAGETLNARFGIPHHRLPLPVGIRLTDGLVEVLTRIRGHGPAPWVEGERGRLVDSYVDGHKYLSGRRAVVYGDADLVVGMAAFLSEIGVRPVGCASGGRGGGLRSALVAAAPELADADDLRVVEDADFARIDLLARETAPDLLVGHSKGYPTARALGIPLIRVGLPVHDRLGGQRLTHVGYRGTQRLFDQIVNTLIGREQDASPVGYAYM